MERHLEDDAKKQWARRAVVSAIRAGLLVRPARCEECGKPKKVQAAHRDYDRPLDVRWLCALCHSTWDHDHRHPDPGPLPSLMLTGDAMVDLAAMAEWREAYPQRVSYLVREARKDAGVSQSEVAAEMGVAQAYVSNVENGKAALSTNRIRDFASAILDLTGEDYGNKDFRAEARKHIAQARGK